MRRGLDRLRAEARGHKHAGGNTPRERLELADGETVDSPAPKGLWRNCYNPAWLKGLKPYQYEALQIIDEDYEFSLDARADL